MLKRSDSKGLSTIVATLLIILLTLVAVGIIWIVVKNVLQSGSEQISLGKFTLDLEISQVQKINDSALNVVIKRNTGEGEIYGLKFIIDDGDKTEVVKQNVSLNELEFRTFSLALTKINASNIKKISIAPIFKLESGKEVTGDVKDEYEISGGSGISGLTCSGSSTQSCSITNGIGSQSRTCTSGNWSAWGTCTVVSCSLGYMQSGNTCVVSTCSGSNFQSCTITNGIGNQTRTCNSGTWSAWGTCTVVSCSTGYQISGNTCVASSQTWQTGMVSWWKFNGNANDYYGRNNGTVNGATFTSTNCKSGQCCSFDGVNDYIDIPDSSSLDLGSFTISAWIYPYEVDAWTTITAKGNASNQFNWYYTLYAGDAEISNAFSSHYARSSSPDYLKNNMYHVVAVADQANSKLKLYINGVEHSYSVQNWSGNSINNDRPVRIGNNEVWGEYFNGSIDEVMIWNRALNSTEISAIYSYSYP